MPAIPIARARPSHATALSKSDAVGFRVLTRFVRAIPTARVWLAHRPRRYSRSGRPCQARPAQSAMPRPAVMRRLLRRQCPYQVSDPCGVSSLGSRPEAASTKKGPAIRSFVCTKPQGGPFRNPALVGQARPIPDRSRTSAERLPRQSSAQPSRANSNRTPGKISSKWLKAGGPEV